MATLPRGEFSSAEGLNLVCCSRSRAVCFLLWIAHLPVVFIGYFFFYLNFSCLQQFYTCFYHLFRTILIDSGVKILKKSQKLSGWGEGCVSFSLTAGNFLLKLFLFLTICSVKVLVQILIGGFSVTDSISRIATVSSATHDGAGSAKDKRGCKRYRHDDDHDTVTISAEARRRAASAEDEWDVSDEE